VDKAITTALLVIASVVAAIAVTNAILPAVNRGTGALLVSSAGVAERVRTDVAIVFSAGNTATNEIRFWAKNVGTQEVKAIDKSDLFLTTPTEIKRITYNASCAAAAPECWSYAFEDGATVWVQPTTIRVTVRLSTLPSGQYTLKFVSPNGVLVEKIFSV
jgi:flagellar protein FlaG